MIYKFLILFCSLIFAYSTDNQNVNQSQPTIPQIDQRVQSFFNNIHATQNGSETYNYPANDLNGRQSANIYYFRIPTYGPVNYEACINIDGSTVHVFRTLINSNWASVEIQSYELDEPLPRLETFFNQTLFLTQTLNNNTTYGL